MTDRDLLAEEFEHHRAHLRSVAYRMLGSLSEADDAVQEAWLRLNRTDTAAVTNLGGWLTTVVFRIDTGGSGPAAREPIVGAAAVARQILARGTPLAPYARPAIVNGAAGAVVAPHGTPIAVVAFTVSGGRIVEIDVIADPAKLAF